MELVAVIGEVRGFLDREGIPFAIVGALALHTYGYSRATNDVDLLVGSEAQGRLIAFLEKRAFQEMADIQFLMRLGGVDRDQIRGYFERSGQVERFHELERSL